MLGHDRPHMSRLVEAAYYGQLARAKLGLSALALASSPVSEADKRAALANSEIVRAVEILYATDQRDLVVPIAADLAERGSDLAMLAALGQQMAQHEDARSTLSIGRGVLGRGEAFDYYAFPTFGLPRRGVR
jgi:soluble lytic murein transglycosylase